MIVESSESCTCIQLDKTPKKLPFIRPPKKFNTDKIRKGRSFLERFDCMLAYLEIQDYAVFLSDIVKAIQIDIQSLYNYISIFTLVKSKPELLVNYNSQIIYPSKFRFKKKMRILLKLRRIKT